MSAKEINYLNRKIDTLKESNKKSFDRVDNRFSRLRRRLERLETYVRDLDFQIVPVPLPEDSDDQEVNQ